MVIINPQRQQLFADKFEEEGRPDQGNPVPSSSKSEEDAEPPEPPQPPAPPDVYLPIEVVEKAKA